MSPFILDTYFDAETLSVHFKEGAIIFAKKGLPGNWRLEAVRKKVLSSHEIQKLIEALLQAPQHEKSAFVEIDKKYSRVLQIGLYCIVLLSFFRLFLIHMR